MSCIPSIHTYTAPYPPSSHPIPRVPLPPPDALFSHTPVCSLTSMATSTPPLTPPFLTAGYTCPHHHLHPHHPLPNPHHPHPSSSVLATPVLIIIIPFLNLIVTLHIPHHLPATLVLIIIFIITFLVLSISADYTCPQPHILPNPHHHPPHLHPLPNTHHHPHLHPLPNTHHHPPHPSSVPATPAHIIILMPFLILIIIASYTCPHHHPHSLPNPYHHPPHPSSLVLATPVLIIIILIFIIISAIFTCPHLHPPTPSSVPSPPVTIIILLIPQPLHQCRLHLSSSSFTSLIPIIFSAFLSCLHAAPVCGLHLSSSSSSLIISATPTCPQFSPLIRHVPILIISAIITCLHAAPPTSPVPNSHPLHPSSPSSSLPVPNSHPPHASSPSLSSTCLITTHTPHQCHPHLSPYLILISILIIIAIFTCPHLRSSFPSSSTSVPPSPVPISHPPHPSSPHLTSLPSSPVPNSHPLSPTPCHLHLSLSSSPNPIISALSTCPHHPPHPSSPFSSSVPTLPVPISHPSSPSSSSVPSSSSSSVSSSPVLIFHPP
uniref:Uncharacterized protein n=1 Tax=Pyxicephalus adspersus TaxID=30357 RepID=A0AAV3A7E3_PYXAD|nr:TPA: hypothetical protein GDO54_017674 [Pyxicephalus adspersus]